MIELSIFLLDLWNGYVTIVILNLVQDLMLIKLIRIPNPAIKIVIASEVARQSRSKPEQDSSLYSEQAPQSRLF